MSLLKSIYNNAIIKGDTIVIDGERSKVLKGKHSLWIPNRQMKIPWSYNGKIISFRDWEKGKQAKELFEKTFNDNERYWDKESLRSIISEYTIFTKMAEHRMAPNITGMFYIKNVISDFYPDTLTNDSKGVYGYFMDNAHNLSEPGTYKFKDAPDTYGYYRVDYLPEKFEQHIEPSLTMSDGAKGDLKKENNVINGYLIDIRRSLFDMMSLKEVPETSYKEIEYMEDVEALKQKIAALTQFPHKQRKENYQSYYIDGEEVDGSRNTVERMELMGIGDDLSNKTVLDLGCNLGSICCESWKRGSRWVMGLDNEADYIDCARDLARHNGYNINYMVKDLTKVEGTSIYINDFFKSRLPINYVFALSLYKHIKGKLFELLDRLNFYECYIESNNAPEGLKTGHVEEMLVHINNRGWRWEHIGTDTTRSPRIILKVTKN